MRGEHSYFRSDPPPLVLDGVPINRLPADGDWIDTPTASRLACTSRQTLYKLPAVRRKSRSYRSSDARGVGLLWSRQDIETVRHIATTCRLRVREAARVLQALTEGRLL